MTGIEDDAVTIQDEALLTLADGLEALAERGAVTISETTAGYRLAVGGWTFSTSDGIREVVAYAVTRLAAGERTRRQRGLSMMSAERVTRTPWEPFRADGSPNGYPRQPPALHHGEDAALSVEMIERVHDLLEQKRVLARVGAGVDGRKVEWCWVLGESGPHAVRATELGVVCDCTAASMGRECAHRLAAMCVWAELGGRKT